MECARDCELLRTIEQVLDNFNNTHSDERKLCVFCHSNVYSTTVGIVHKDMCIIKQIRSEATK